MHKTFLKLIIHINTLLHSPQMTFLTVPISCTQYRTCSSHTWSVEKFVCKYNSHNVHLSGNDNTGANIPSTRDGKLEAVDVLH